MASSSDVTTGKALSTASEIASMLAKSLPGPASLAMLGVASLLRAMSTAILHRGESVDSLLKSIREPRKLDMPWSEDDPTHPATPSAKTSAKKRES